MTSKWLTNIEHGKLHVPLDLVTMEENLRFGSEKSKILRTRGTTPTTRSKSVKRWESLLTTTELFHTQPR